MLQWTPAQARAAWLRSQWLEDPSYNSELPGPQCAQKVIRQLGYVQIDTIYVVERAHHQVLWTRVPHYRASDLSILQSKEKSIFEYWTHALSYIPVEDFRFFVRRMKQKEKTPGKWYQEVQTKALKELLLKIKKEGPLSIADIDEEKKVKDHLWASKKPSKRALELLFYSGKLVISAREGMRKRYDLTERHFQWGSRPKACTLKEELQYRLNRALRAQGIATLDSIVYLETGEKKQMATFIKELLQRKHLIEVEVPEWKKTFIALPEVERLGTPVQSDKMSLLSPFDPLVIQRKRTECFFDFKYKLECYEPKHKRVHGYFVLPILRGDRFLARLDLKIDRPKRKLLIQSWHWENRKFNAASIKREIDEKLHEYEAFCLEAPNDTIVHRESQ